MRKFYQATAIMIMAVALSVSSQTSYGHGACNTFFNWTCDGNPRWSSSAALFSFSTLQAAQITPFQCYPYPVAAHVSKPWGSQYTKYTYGVGCQRSGWVRRWYQARGNEFSSLVNEFIGEMMDEPAPAADTPNVEVSEVVEESVELNAAERTISVRGINAECKVWVGEPVHSTIRYEIWQRTSETDEEFDESKVIRSTHLSVNGTIEGAIGDGELRGIAYSVLHEGGYRILKISGASVTVPVPASADLDLLAIRLVSDGGGDDAAIMGEAIMTSEKKLVDNKFVFNIFPNPSSGILNIDLVSPVEMTAQIKIYDITGRLTSVDVPTRELPAGLATTVKIDCNPLSPGNYYVVVQAKDAKYVKQVSIVR